MKRGLYLSMKGAVKQAIKFIRCAGASKPATATAVAWVELSATEKGRIA